MAMTSAEVPEPVEGETRVIECQEPISRIRSKESLKQGNLKGKSLAVRREQNIGPFAHEEDRPWVWSE